MFDVQGLYNWLEEEAGKARPEEATIMLRYVQAHMASIDPSLADTPEQRKARYEARQARLDAAFALVQPKTHWKDPIDAIVPDEADQDAITDAVIEYTGSIPSFTKLSPHGYRVRADGYYASIGS